jgi:hypothetical protein
VLSHEDILLLWNLETLSVQEGIEALKCRGGNIELSPCEAGEALVCLGKVRHRDVVCMTIAFVPVGRRAAHHFAWGHSEVMRGESVVKLAAVRGCVEEKVSLENILALILREINQ